MKLQWQKEQARHESNLLDDGDGEHRLAGLRAEGRINQQYAETEDKHAPMPGHGKTDRIFWRGDEELVQHQRGCEEGRIMPAVAMPLTSRISLM